MTHTLFTSLTVVSSFNRSRLPSYLNHVTVSARLDTRKGQRQGDEEQIQEAEGEASVSDGGGHCGEQQDQDQQVEAQTGQRTGEGGSGRGQQTISLYFQVK